MAVDLNKDDISLISKIKKEIEKAPPRDLEKQILLLAHAQMFKTVASEVFSVSGFSNDVLRGIVGQSDPVVVVSLTDHLRDKIKRLRVLTGHLKEVFNYEDGSAEETIGVAFCSILDSVIDMCTEVYATAMSNQTPGEHTVMTIGTKPQVRTLPGSEG